MNFPTSAISCSGYCWQRGFLYIVEDKSGNLSIMTLTEYINYRKSIR